MKKLYLLISIVFLVPILNAQTYHLTKSTSTYTPLSGATIVSGSTPWSSFQSHTIPIGFNFNFFDQIFDTIYIEGSGFTRFDPGYQYVLNPFTVHMQDAGTGSPTSLSPLSYVLSGTAPNRILTIQWENCEMANDTGSFVNFQLSLHESGSVFEIHFGSMNVNNVTDAFTGHSGDGPVVGLYDDVQNVGFFVNGAPPAEFLQGVSGIGSIFNHSMDAVPNDGQIYTFNQLNHVESLNESWVSVYPNPVVNEVFLSSNDIVKYDISDLLGKVVQQGTTMGRINIDEIPTGVYYLRLSIGNQYCVRKMVKQ